MGVDISWWSLILATISGSMIGTVIGMLPGLGAITCIAIAMPFLISFPPYISLAFIAAIYYGSQYGGSTTSILFNIPGETSSIVTCIDGNLLSKQGRSGSALTTAAISSFGAGIVAAILTYLFSPMLAALAVKFTPVEIFFLSVVGLYFATTSFSGNKAAAIYSTMFGVLLSFVGVNSISGVVRFTHDIDLLYDGFNIAIVAAGLLGGAELIKQLSLSSSKITSVPTVSSLKLTTEEKKECLTAGSRGTLIGSFLGLIPGGGGVMASYLAYSIERFFTPSLGSGKIQGIAAPEAANNAASQTGFIPLLALGIPENAIMSIIFGLLIQQGVVFGPSLFAAENPLVPTLIVSMLLGNAMLIILNLPLIPYLSKIYLIPNKVLMSISMAFLLVGIYLIQYSTFDLLILLVFSSLGIYFRYVGLPTIPLIMGFMLGPQIEDRFIKSLIISNGDPLVFLHSAIAQCVIAIVIIVYIVKFLIRRSKSKISI
jgi:putative tricarboxylic transport membrane protein